MPYASQHRHGRTVVTAAALLFTAACAADSVTAPRVGAPGIGGPSGVVVATAQTVTVCKAAGSPAGTFHFLVSATGRLDPNDQMTQAVAIVVPAGSLHDVCSTVYTRTDAETANSDTEAWVSVTELEHHETGLSAVHITTDGLPGSVDLLHHSATMSINAFHSSRAVFVHGPYDHPAHHPVNHPAHQPDAPPIT